jgi:hypothetical protein
MAGPPRGAIRFPLSSQKRLGAEEEVVRRLRRGEPVVFVDPWRDARPPLPPTVNVAVAYCASPRALPRLPADELLFVHGRGDVRVLEGGSLACGRAERAAGEPLPRRRKEDP